MQTKRTMTKNKLPRQYLNYNFTFENRRHKGRFSLDEDSTPNLRSLYDDRNLEVTYLKRIHHNGSRIELSIVLDDDAYKNPGSVAASAWVSVYRKGVSVASFEPDHWSYTDEADASHNTCKETFYKKTA